MFLYVQTNPDFRSFKLSPSAISVGDAGCTSCAILSHNKYFGGSESFTAGIEKLDYLSDGRILWGSVNKLSKLNFEYRVFAGDYSATDRNAPGRVRIREAMLAADKCVALEIKIPNGFGGRHWVVCLGLENGGYRVGDVFDGQTKTVRLDQVVGAAIFKINK